MVKMLRFKKEPNLTDLEKLSINGATFKNGEGYFTNETIVMVIPNTFRFSTKLEIFTHEDNNEIDLIMTQFLTRGPEYWEMEDAFSRIGFRNPEIEEQMRSLCEELLKMDLVHWVEN